MTYQYNIKENSIFIYNICTIYNKEAQQNVQRYHRCCRILRIMTNIFRLTALSVILSERKFYRSGILCLCTFFVMFFFFFFFMSKQKKHHQTCIIEFSEYLFTLEYLLRCANKINIARNMVPCVLQMASYRWRRRLCVHNAQFMLILCIRRNIGTIQDIGIYLLSI